MAILKLIENEESIYYQSVLKKITNKEINEAKQIFEKYKEQGVIMSDYEDDAWKVSNEVFTTTISVNINEVDAAKNLKIISVKELKNIIKVYIVFLLGTTGLNELRNLAVGIRKVLIATKYFSKYPENDECLKDYKIQTFLQLIPELEEQYFVECDYYHGQGENRRTLAEYQSYFIFNDIINEYFPSAPQKEKERYFPVFIWWKITTVLPLRATETLVIPYDCVTYKNEKYYIKVRRSKLKGSDTEIRHYNVKQDYKIYEYETTKEIADMVAEYKDLCKKYKKPNSDALLSSEMFYETYSKEYNYGMKKDEKYITRAHMARLLRNFYNQVIGKKYNYQILNKVDMDTVDEHGELRSLADNEIVQISLGDTRHIAIQNMMLNGCNILLANEITAHNEINTIFHYAGNLKNLVKCKAYSLNKKNKREEMMDFCSKKETNRVDNILNPIQGISYVNVENGRCYSPNMVDHDNPKDCYVTAGDCECCKYYRCENVKKTKDITKLYEIELENRIKRLDTWLRSKNSKNVKKEIQIQYEQLRTAAENLKTIYLRELELKESEE